MIRLLVNAPTGEQEIISIDESGAYFDPARVLWDERVDGALPAVTLGKMQRTGNQLVELNDYLPSYISAAKEAKEQELKMAYETAVTAPITHNSIVWAAGRDDQSLLVSCLVAGSVPPGMYWRDLNKTPHAMTYTDLQALAGAMIARGFAADENLQDKIAAVTAASTVAAVNAIVWGT